MGDHCPDWTGAEHEGRDRLENGHKEDAKVNTEGLDKDGRLCNTVFMAAAENDAR